MILNVSCICQKLVLRIPGGCQQEDERCPLWDIGPTSSIMCVCLEQIQEIPKWAHTPRLSLSVPLAVDESEFTSGSAAYSLCKLEQGFSSCASFSS